MAVTDERHSHQPGIWKQQNKSHKNGRHRSKGQIDLANKGRVPVKTSTKRHKKPLQRVDRRNQSKQIRSRKREEVLNRKRCVGIGHNPPHLTVLVPLHESVDISKLSESIRTCGSLDGTVVSAAPLTTAGFTLNVPRLKHRFQIIQPGTPSHADILDCVQVADTIVFLLACDENEPFDQQGHNILSCLLAQGMPSQVFCVKGFKDLAVKVRNTIKKEIIKKLERQVANVKFHAVDTDQETHNLLRTVAEMKRQKINVREKRPYMLVEKMTHECEENAKDGILKVSGHMRGFPLDVNRLVHLVGWGDYQIKQIDETAEHCPWNVQKAKHTGDGTGSMEDQKVLIRGKSFSPWENTGFSITCNPELQENLILEADVDPMEGEQTWPTEEEIAEARKEALAAKTKMVKKVPEGTSKYQAAWILDNDQEWEECDEDGSGSENEVEEEMDEDLAPREEEESQVGDEIESVMMSELDDTASQYDAKISDDPNDLARFREERSHEEFPDEVDTPADVPARVRFQKYRGLQSFRTSPWDPKENLPLDYARIFQFQSFNRTKKRIHSMNADEATSVKPGTYVTIHLMNVPKAFVDNHAPDSPLTLFGLFPHEQKMSVLHFALKQFGEHTMKSKDEFLFHVGFRRFRAKATFSQHTLGSKHKMERFFPKQAVVVATVYAPITFPPANVLTFKESNGDLDLVATGTLYKIDPDRIITKRIVLSGHPFRINNQAATIRYMFFNKDDILWFKPVELKTKWGRRGHIREALGTHGHMKCLFDAQLMSQDTVLMTLYKRVFPKWSYEPATPLSRGAASVASSHSQSHEMFDEEFFES